MTGFEAAKKWINGRTFHRDRVNRKYDSYGLKHMAEKAMGVYISNEDFINAMEDEGFKKYQTLEMRASNSPNYLFYAAFTGLKGAQHADQR
jgi:hypothetical protein